MKILHRHPSPLWAHLSAPSDECAAELLCTEVLIAEAVRTQDYIELMDRLAALIAKTIQYKRGSEEI